MLMKLTAARPVGLISPTIFAHIVQFFLTGVPWISLDMMPSL